jgi:hypothetical protein
MNYWRRVFAWYGWRNELEPLGKMVLVAVGIIAVGLLAETMGPKISSALQAIAACPIHVVASSPDGYPRDDYCLHLGIGR